MNPTPISSLFTALDLDGFSQIFSGAYSCWYMKYINFTGPRVDGEAKLVSKKLKISPAAEKKGKKS